MKYKGINLLSSGESESEICIAIDFSNSNCSIKDVTNFALEVLSEYDIDAYAEIISNDLVLIKNDDITFDKEGITTLESMYEHLTLLFSNPIFINVHVDGLFENEDGEYNTDEVDWEVFIENLQY